MKSFVSLIAVAALALFAGDVAADDCHAPRIVQRVQVQKVQQVKVQRIVQQVEVQKVVVERVYVPAQIVTERVVERFYTVPSAPTVEIRRFIVK